MSTDIKQELIWVLKPLFGEDIIKMIGEYYDSNNPQEIINVTHKLLSDFMGEENTDNILQNIIKKFPKLKVRLH